MGARQRGRARPQNLALGRDDVYDLGTQWRSFNVRSTHREELWLRPIPDDPSQYAIWCCPTRCDAGRRLGGNRFEDEGACFGVSQSATHRGLCRAVASSSGQVCQNSPPGCVLFGEAALCGDNFGDANEAFQISVYPGISKRLPSPKIEKGH